MVSAMPTRRCKRWFSRCILFGRRPPTTCGQLVTLTVYGASMRAKTHKLKYVSGVRSAVYDGALCDIFRGLRGVLCMFILPYRRLSLHVLNGGRQCMCAIADTLLNGVRGCGHSMAAPVRWTMTNV